MAFRFGSRATRAFNRHRKRIERALTSPTITHRLGKPIFALRGTASEGRLSLQDVRRVLVIRTDSIGDVVITSAFLRELRRNLPAAHITLVVASIAENLVEHCPYVDEVITFDADTSSGRYLLRHFQALSLAWSRLWSRRFDLAIVPRFDWDAWHATYLAYFSGARWRVAYSERLTPAKQTKNRDFDKLLTHALSADGVEHEVVRSLEIIEQLGGTVRERKMELWLQPSDVEFARKHLNGVREDDALIGLGLSAGTPRRRWPIERFIAVGELLKHRSGNVKLVAFGGPGEEHLGSALSDALGDSVVDVVGKATLRQSAALLEQCCLYAGNDTGVMHLAAAAGVPVVELSCHPLGGLPNHANAPERFGPWMVESKVLRPLPAAISCAEGCEVDAPHCIVGIEPDQVADAVTEYLTVPRYGTLVENSRNGRI